MAFDDGFDRVAGALLGSGIFSPNGDAERFEPVGEGWHGGILPLFWQVRGLDVISRCKMLEVIVG